MPSPRQPRKTRNLLAVAVAGAALTCVLVCAATLGNRYGLRWDQVLRWGRTGHWSSHRPLHLQRPYGMAPIAFDAFVRACSHAAVNPDRIGQTIGDDPRSVGYHHRDGTLTWRGADYDYTAATDIDVSGLTDKQISLLLHELARQGFACWYRHGGKWVGDEHIHAVYALLPMKPQLQRQVKLFLRERREAGLQPLRWEVKLHLHYRRLALR